MSLYISHFKSICKLMVVWEGFFFLLNGLGK